tara:strand:+ start:1261 stop:1401 length:141 start_codon:yes stop_codon:yes gene_type:complete
MEMASDAHYRSQAISYRNSPQYQRMIGLYPVLRSSIGECKDEKLFS